jgi:nucleoside-diphosphate-sugar epimerase
MKKTIVIAGATGFIGRWFMDTYSAKYNIIALSRKEVKEQPKNGIEWRKVELYSITDTTKVLNGADYALYLVHSMTPSTRLNQGNFEDTDLILADNFARAAAANHLKQIVFIGGILPKEGNPDDLSTHLKSRYEVEHTLAAYETPVTTLRAGIILGAGGSSFNIVKKLVERLPVMLCPKWTESLTQPMALDDILVCIDKTFGNQPLYGKSIEVGGDEVLTYRQMLEMTAKLMQKKRWVFTVPFFSIELSKLWVGYFSGSNAALVSPLVESLKHTMILDQSIPKELEYTPTPIGKAISLALNPQKKLSNLPAFMRPEKKQSTVRSYQRIPNAANRSSEWVANRYKTWLPVFFKFFILAKEDGPKVQFFISIVKKPMLELTLIESRSDASRQLFYITGGWLVARVDNGWLEFRSLLNNKYIITVIHEFVPSLPWYIYVNTQARIHLWVMNRFSSYLQKLAARKNYQPIP